MFENEKNASKTLKIFKKFLFNKITHIKKKGGGMHLTINFFFKHLQIKSLESKTS